MIRNAYLRKVERRLDGLEAEIDFRGLEEEAASADPAGPLARRIYILRNRMAVARERVRDVRNAEPGKWGPLRKSADDAVDEAERTLEKAIRNRHDPKCCPP